MKKITYLIGLLSCITLISTPILAGFTTETKTTYANKFHEYCNTPAWVLAGGMCLASLYYAGEDGAITRCAKFKKKIENLDPFSINSYKEAYRDQWYSPVYRNAVDELPFLNEQEKQEVAKLLDEHNANITKKHRLDEFCYDMFDLSPDTINDLDKRLVEITALCRTGVYNEKSLSGPDKWQKKFMLLAKHYPENTGDELCKHAINIWEILNTIRNPSTPPLLHNAQQILNAHCAYKQEIIKEKICTIIDKYIDKHINRKLWCSGIAAALFFAAGLYTFPTITTTTTWHR